MTRIVIIDDEDPVRAMLRDVLEEEGYEVAEAADGWCGLQLLTTAPADLVITDILMPDKEGIETIREVRADHPNVPVIAMSGGGAVGNLDFLQLARDFGAAEVLQKPIRIDKLLDAVTGVLNGTAIGDHPSGRTR